MMASMIRGVWRIKRTLKFDLTEQTLLAMETLSEPVRNSGGCESWSGVYTYELREGTRFSMDAETIKKQKNANETGGSTMNQTTVSFPFQ